jgi:N-acetylmuramic acid 6-phosphate etherase
MIKLGKVYGNLMVDLKASNDKLKDRSLRILCKLTGLKRDDAEALLVRASGQFKPAIVMHFRKSDLKTAQKILKQNHDSLRNAIEDTL